MMTCGQLFFINRSIRHKLDKHHFLRQIDITPFCVLRINRCNHNLISQHQLIFHLRCEGILRIFKGKRFKIHVIKNGRLHVFTVEIRKQAVTDFNHMTEILHMFKLIAFLLSRINCGMVPHKRRKHAKGKPAQQQVSRCVSAKSAQICSCIQEAAHIQRRHHFQVQQNMIPPGFVIPCPDTPIAVHSNVRRTREQ